MRNEERGLDPRELCPGVGNDVRKGQCDSKRLRSDALAESLARLRVASSDEGSASDSAHTIEGVVESSLSAVIVDFSRIEDPDLPRVPLRPEITFRLDGGSAETNETS